MPLYGTFEGDTQFSMSKKAFRELRCLNLKLNYFFFFFLTPFCFQTGNGSKYQTFPQGTFMRHSLELHIILPRNLKSLKDCFLPEAFLNYCHQNREQYRRKAEGASGAAPSFVEMHLEKLFVEQTSSHLHCFYSPPFSIYES